MGTWARSHRATGCKQDKEVMVDLETLGNSRRFLSRRVPNHSGRSGAMQGKEAEGRFPLEAAARVQVKYQEPEIGLGMGIKMPLGNTKRDELYHLNY